LLRRGTTDFRIGLEWPLGQSGASPFSLSQAMQIRQRILTGSQAFAAEIKQDLGLLSEQSGKLHFGLEFRDAFTPTISSLPPSAFADNNFADTNSKGKSSGTLYYLALSTHAYLQYRLPDQTMRGAYIQLGGGMHSIQPFNLEVQSIPDKNAEVPQVNLLGRLDYFDPFVKLGYVHSSDAGDEYGVSVQYSNELLTDGWVKLFPWLQLEVKYATVIGRDPEPWEWKDYVMVSPKLTLNF
jgi:hypothetical protein